MLTVSHGHLTPESPFTDYSHYSTAHTPKRWWQWCFHWQCQSPAPRQLCGLQQLHCAVWKRLAHSYFNVLHSNLCASSKETKMKRNTVLLVRFLAFNFPLSEIGFASTESKMK